jgi:hypothetical protein
MSDLVTSQVLANGSKRTVRKFTSVSDGTGESNVVKVDISSLTNSPTSVKIVRVWYSVVGMVVKVGYDHNTNDFTWILNGDGVFDLREVGGSPDPGSTGGTGDILFTTIGHDANDTYDITLEIEL